MDSGNRVFPRSAQGIQCMLRSIVGRAGDTHSISSLSPFILHLDIKIPTFFMVCYDHQRFCVSRHIVEEYQNQNRRHTQAGISEVPGHGKNGLEGFPGKTGK